MVSSRIQQNVKPRKRFGQNFLQDKSIILKIVKAIAPKKSDHIVEIGPGLGALTMQLLPILKTMDVIELDRDLIPKLQSVCRNLGKLNIHRADALQFDFKKLVKNKQLLRVIGNLPYNISTPLIFHLLKQINYICDMHFMLQKEIARRLAAKPNHKDYGRLSVMVQYFCEVTELFTVSPHAFYPVPKVESALVHFVPHKRIFLPAKDVSGLEKVVKLAFNQRRKMILNCLKGLVSKEQFSSLNIDTKLRPEQLSVEDFVRISNII